jgi:hypothetical protein
VNVAKNELGKKKRFGGFIEIWAVGGLSADQTEISQLLYESEKRKAYGLGDCPKRAVFCVTL